MMVDEVYMEVTARVALHVSQNNIDMESMIVCTMTVML